MTHASFGDLPELLAEIAEVAGLDAALKIAEAKGGQRVYIPAYPREGHWLWLAVGPETAAKICDHFRTLDPESRAIGGRNTPLVIPFGPAHGAAAAARRAFAAGIAEGLSVRDASRKAGIHERTGFYAVKRMKLRREGSAATPTLFDAGLEEPRRRGKTGGG